MATSKRFSETRNHRVAVKHIKQASDRLWDYESNYPGKPDMSVSEIRRMLDSVQKYLQFGEAYAPQLSSTLQVLKDHVDLVANGLEP